MQERVARPTGPRARQPHQVSQQKRGRTTRARQNKVLEVGQRSWRRRGFGCDASLGRTFAPESFAARERDLNFIIARSERCW
jgi:hypothetical protein